MQYRGRVHQHISGKFTDVFDGSHYRSLRGRHVQLNGKTFPHKYFEDHRDVALGLSADGFSTFESRKQSAWAFILLNYNLPPDTRFHVENILALGVIGPKKPVDFDSFLWPAIQELLRLLVGVRAFDALASVVFCLRAFLILVFGDIPAVSSLMQMKGHSGVLPCRMCKIIGLRIPKSRATHHYVPLERSRHPDTRMDPNAVGTYDAHDLPMRAHTELRRQGEEVQMALTNDGAADIGKAYGVKGLSIFHYLPSISFPISFPYDFMHLIWENVVQNLVSLWTGSYNGLDEGTESYELPQTVWDAIGLATAASGSHIPSAYGTRVPDIAKHKAYYSAEMWSFWVLYLGPVLLQRRFQRPKYYTHFICLVYLLNLCLQFEISTAEIEEIRHGFAQWVQEFEAYVATALTCMKLFSFLVRIYYQYEPSRLSCCRVTIHALLHISNSIKATGPVWCYWAFPMERYCGVLHRAVRSRRFPYASLARFVSETTQLTQIANVYDIADILALRPAPSLPGDFSHPQCMCDDVSGDICVLTIYLRRSIMRVNVSKISNKTRR
jgi:hypothetical protein